MPNVRDDSAGNYGSWSNPEDQSWYDWLRMKAADVQEGGKNAQTNILSALSPYGDEGWQVPPAVHEPINALSRLFGTPSNPGTFGQGPDAPGNKEDMTTLLMSMYGGNAMNPMAAIPKGSLASGALREAPQRMYHGTAAAEDFSHFRPSSEGSFGPGVYLSENPAIASQRALLDDGSRVFPVDAQGPFASVDDYLTALHGNGRDPSAAQRVLADQGYTGVSGDLGSYGAPNPVTNVFQPGSIRSATTGETLYSDGLPSIWGNALAPQQDEPRNALMDYAQNDQGPGNYLKDRMDQPYQPAPGEDFQYTPITPDISSKLSTFAAPLIEKMMKSNPGMDRYTAGDKVRKSQEFLQYKRTLVKPQPFNPPPSP